MFIDSVIGSLHRGLKKVAIPFTVLFSVFKKRKRIAMLMTVMRPDYMPIPYEYEGKRYFVVSMLFEFLKNDKEKLKILRSHLNWHARSLNHKVEKVEPAFIENLIGNDLWSVWWKTSGKIQSEEYIVESSVWNEVCRTFMRGSKREKVSRVL